MQACWAMLDRGRPRFWPAFLADSSLSVDWTRHRAMKTKLAATSGLEACTAGYTVGHVARAGSAPGTLLATLMATKASQGHKGGLFCEPSPTGSRRPGL